MTAGKVLVVAEKPSICNSIAHALSGGHMTTRGGSPPIHEFVASFAPDKSHAPQQYDFKVTSVVGHVFSVDFPQEYQNWNSTEPRELFDAPIKRKAEKQGIVKLLERESKGCSYCVLFLDCDREGENIAFEVIDIIKPHMAKLPPNANRSKLAYPQFLRAKFSAVTPSDIQKAMRTLDQPNPNEAHAVDARQELDLKVGVAFSRFQTQFFQGKYTDLDASVVSYGPCQTPTLGFCVRRYIDIASFKPESYWTLQLQLGKSGRSVSCEWSRGRVFDVNVGHMFHRLCSGGENSSTIFTIDSVKQSKVKQGRPLPLNTVALLKLASKALGIGPHHCMQVAERLYLQGYLSYPRTESTQFPSSYDIRGAIELQTRHPTWGSHAQGLITNGYTAPKSGFDAGDHPPITPTRAMTSTSEFSGDMVAIYKLVATMFLASVSPDAVYHQTKVVVSCPIGLSSAEDETPAREKFTASGREMISPGFLSVTTEVDADAIVGLPSLSQGEKFVLSENLNQDNSCTLVLKERKTSPPEHLSESELIGLMEKNGIGTDASIPTHIENILKRNYVTLESGRRLVPTKLGLVLVQGYHRIDPDLVMPRVRSAIEGQCNLIAKGQADKQVVVEQALLNFKAKFLFFSEHIGDMDELFGASFATLQDSGKPWTRCGITGRYLSFIEGPPARLYNRFTETVYSLPQGGKYKQLSGRLCDTPDCKFEMMLYGVGNPVRNYPLCPYCFNNPREEWGLTPETRMEQLEAETENLSLDAKGNPQQDAQRQVHRKVGGQRLCLECPHPDLHPSIVRQTVCDDPETGGVMILDPTGGPNWKFVSTRGAYIAALPPKQVNKVTVLSKRDEETGGRYVKIDFHKDHVPRAQVSEGTEYTGCIDTDEFLQSLLQGKEVSNRLKGGRRFRGKGRRGRGRGRKREDPRMSFHSF